MSNERIVQVNKSSVMQYKRITVLNKMYVKKIVIIFI